MKDLLQVPFQQVFWMAGSQPFLHIVFYYTKKFTAWQFLKFFSPFLRACL